MSGPLIGILGGGQLGRMLALAGYPLGFRFRVFDPSPDAVAGQVAELHTGSFEDLEALDRFAEGTEFLTLEWENVPLEALQHLERRGYLPRPGSQALWVAQDRLREKTFFQGLGIPTPSFQAVSSRFELEAAAADLGYPCVLKTRRNGYDGKGQFVLRSPADVGPAWAELGGHELILEGWVPFDRELSLLAVRGASGAACTYPLVQNHHRHGILHHSVAPAPAVGKDLAEQAAGYAGLLLEGLDYHGVLALELFQVGDRLLASEMAPRVHNSGHWTLQGAETSQFENHLRAVTGMPLGSTEPVGYSLLLNVLGEEPEMERVLRAPGIHLHRYGKEPRPGRKLGHITVRGRDSEAVQERLQFLQSVLGEDRLRGVSPHPWAGVA